jgi:hypothetical protein
MGHLGGKRGKVSNTAGGQGLEGQEWFIIKKDKEKELTQVLSRTLSWGQRAAAPSGRPQVGWSLCLQPSNCEEGRNRFSLDQKLEKRWGEGRLKLALSPTIRHCTSEFANDCH